MEISLFTFAFIMLLVWLLSIIFHELGHAFYYIIQKRDVQITFKYVKGSGFKFYTMGNKLKSDNERAMFYLFGIFSGMIVIGICSTFYNDIQYLYIPYFIASFSDIRKVMKLKI